MDHHHVNDTVCQSCGELIWSDYEYDVEEHDDGTVTATCHRCMRKKSSQSWKPEKTQNEKP